MIRLINNDIDLLTEAYKWQFDTPKWFQETMSVWPESKDEYLENSKQEVHYGIFDGDELISSLRCVEAAPYVMEMHWAMKRKVDFNLIFSDAQVIRDHLFANDVKMLYGYIASRNQSLIKFAKNLGFYDTGSRRYKGLSKNKVIEWTHIVCENNYC